MFQSLFIAGFEGATGYDRHGRWFDQVAATLHDREVENDYRLIAELGFRVARECVRWPLVDLGGRRFDFSTVQPMIDAARRNDVEVIWDLFHFGYPPGLDVLSGEFVDRFSDYCDAVARYIAQQTDGTLWVTPVNEPSYFAYAAGEQKLFAPHLSGSGRGLKLALVRAAIAGVNAIRSVVPDARIINVDPLCRVAAPEGRPDFADAVSMFNDHYVFEAWDMLAGRLLPELGGSPSHLDIVGINYYWTNQWELGGSTGADGVTAPLAENDPRRVPLADLVAGVMERYGPDVIVSETSHYGISRAAWMHEIGHQMHRLAGMGRRPHGICLYPIIGMTDWHDPHRWVPMGLWDQFADDGNGLVSRPVHEPMLTALLPLLRSCQNSAQRRTAAVVNSRSRPRERNYGRGSG
jgi:hypothetical protein